MRARGADVADIALLIIAADDGVMPQTQEALKYIRDSKTPFIVVFNKVDKPDANVQKIRRSFGGGMLQLRAVVAMFLVQSFCHNRAGR